MSYHTTLLLVVALTGCLLCTTSTADKLPTEEIIAKAEALLSTPASRLQQEIDMRDYVKFASVAAESRYDKDTRECAEWLRLWLKERLGMEDAALYESGYRHPVVVASSGGDESKPAVIIYGNIHTCGIEASWIVFYPEDYKECDMIVDIHMYRTLWRAASRWRMDHFRTIRGQKDTSGRLWWSLHRSR